MSEGITVGFAERIRNAPPSWDGNSPGDTYDRTADYAARLILEWLLADPSRALGPTENVYENQGERDKPWTGVVLEVGWYDRMKDDGVPLEQLGLTGFQWGWAVNAARGILGLLFVPNPAIITISVPDD